MHKQDKNPKPKSQAQIEQQQQLQHIRQETEKQLAQLKLHIQHIHHNSLKEMLEVINTTFKAQAVELKHLGQQEHDAMKEATQVIKESEARLSEAMKNISVTGVDASHENTLYDGGAKAMENAMKAEMTAMENAQKGAELAMKNALSLMKTSENTASDLPNKQNPPHAETEKKVAQ